MSEEQGDLHFDNFTGLLFKHKIDLSKRTILISEDITNKTYIKFDQSMSLLESISKEPILIKINTYGGDVYEMFAIIERARNSKCVIITEGYGKVMSAGVLLLAMGDLRRISEYATVMVHGINYGVQRGNTAYVKNEIKHNDKLEHLYLSFLAKHTKKSYIYWKARCKGMDQYIDAQETIELGIADELMEAAR